MNKKHYDKKGFIALTAVLIMGALFLSISIGITSRSILGVDESIGLLQSQQAQKISEACVEFVLIELLRTLQYTGGQTLAIGAGSCDILSIVGSGNDNRQIQIVTTVGEYVHRVEVEVSVSNPDLELVSWNTVIDF